MTRFGHQLNYIINTFVKHTPDDPDGQVEARPIVTSGSIR